MASTQGVRNYPSLFIANCQKKDMEEPSRKLVSRCFTQRQSRTFKNFSLTRQEEKPHQNLYIHVSNNLTYKTSKLNDNQQSTKK